MDLVMQVASPIHNDSFFALFNESMRECVCSLYPKFDKTDPGLGFYVTAWLALLLFMLIIISVCLYVVYSLQECTKFMQKEVDHITRTVERHRYWLSEPHLH